MTYSSTILADSPTAYYKLNETSGTTATDQTSNHFDGTLNGSGITLNQTAIAVGLDPCMLFDGSAGFITLPTGVNLTPPFSIDMWIKGNSVAANGDLYSNNATGGVGFSWDFGGGNKIFVYGAGGSYDTTNALTSGSVYYLCLTVNTSHDYVINAGLVGTDNAPSQWGTGNPAAGPTYSGSSVVGKRSDSSNHFKGYISEIAVYPVVLTGTQMNTHYTAGITAASAGRVRPLWFNTPFNPAHIAPSPFWYGHPFAPTQATPIVAKGNARTTDRIVTTVLGPARSQFNVWAILTQRLRPLWYGTPFNPARVKQSPFWYGHPLAPTQATPVVAQGNARTTNLIAGVITGAARTTFNVWAILTQRLRPLWYGTPFNPARVKQSPLWYGHPLAPTQATPIVAKGNARTTNLVAAIAQGLARSTFNITTAVLGAARSTFKIFSALTQRVRPLWFGSPFNPGHIAPSPLWYGHPFAPTQATPIVAKGNARTTSKTAAVTTGTARSVFKVSALVLGKARSTFLSSAAIKGLARSTFKIAAVVQGLSRSAFWIAAVAKGAARTTFLIGGALLQRVRPLWFGSPFNPAHLKPSPLWYGHPFAPTQATPMIAAGKALTTSKTASQNTGAARSTFKIKVSLLGKALTTSKIAAVVKGYARSRFFTKAVTKVWARSRFLLANTAGSLPIGSVFNLTRQSLSVASSIKNALSSAPMVKGALSVASTIRGYLLVPKQLQSLTIVRQGNAMPAPFSTIQSTITVTDVAGALVSNASVVSVLVTFPDNTTLTIGLGAGVTNIGSGQYKAIYNTKGVGLLREVWSVTAADSVTLATFSNDTPVAY